MWLSLSRIWSGRTAPSETAQSRTCRQGDSVVVSPCAAGRPTTIRRERLDRDRSLAVSEMARFGEHRARLHSHVSPDPLLAADEGRLAPLLGEGRDEGKSPAMQFSLLRVADDSRLRAIVLHSDVDAISVRLQAQRDRTRRDLHSVAQELGGHHRQGVDNAPGWIRVHDSPRREGARDEVPADRDRLWAAFQDDLGSLAQGIHLQGAPTASRVPYAEHP